jgi:hypothetical protein
VRVAELKNETFIAGTDDLVQGYRRQVTRICRSCGKFRPRLIGNSGDLSNGLANEDAIALLPAFMRHRTAPGVVLIPVADARATWNLFVVWQRGQNTSVAGSARRSPISGTGLKSHK